VAALFEFVFPLGLAVEMYFRDSLQMSSNRAFIFYVRECSEAKNILSWFSL